MVVKRKPGKLEELVHGGWCSMLGWLGNGWIYKKGRRGFLGWVRTWVVVGWQEGKSNHECQDVLSLWFVLLLPTILVGLEAQYAGLASKLQCLLCPDQAELIFHHQSVGGH
jgi:hypothetical protein